MKTVGLVSGLVILSSILALGCAGDDGEPGSAGLVGEQGEPGPQGEPGEKGDPGAPGEPGEQGESGEQGEPGEKGDTGEQGEPGEKGDTGEKGEPGETGDTGEKGEPGEQGEPGDSGPKAPGFVLFDADDQAVDAWIVQSPGVPYGEEYAPVCVDVLWIGQRNANSLAIDLETGRPEPCYESYPDWTTAAAANSSIIFNSTNCSGAPYSAHPGSGVRYVVDGELYEVRGPIAGPWGLGTDEPYSQYPNSDEVCVDQSATPYQQVQAILPGDPEFIDYFDNPPYTVKIVY
jgi:hypothetical protein